MTIRSVFANNFISTTEQNLIEDLCIESIQIYGYEVQYLPRTLNKEDKLFGEDILSTFESANTIEMYIRNVEGFEGEGDFLSKFNLEIRDTITFTVARKRFAEEIPFLPRPREGDLIFFGLTKKLYEVMFVEHETIFYQLGDLQVYDLRCELFEYSSEVVNTGIDIIDSIVPDLSISNTDVDVINVYSDRDEIDILINEAAASNNDIIDFSEANPFSEGNPY